jgi:UDPglucose 6-dehydrogenase
VVVVKSTVVPGTTVNEVIPLIEKASGKVEGKDFAVAMNPEFLREGIALNDFLNPDRIVLGSNNKKALKALRKLYSKFSGKVMETDPTTAEMIKYASNSFLATKISFINEIGNICKKLGINTEEVAKGMSLDKRISPFFLKAGVGFGGSCFPKDIKALMHKARELRVSTKLLDAVMQVNDEQPLKLLELAKKRTSLKGKRVGVLGLAFKPGTDDVRESRAVVLINELQKLGARVLAHDPKAEENMKAFFPDIQYSDSAQKVVDESEVVFILTAWKDYIGLDYKDRLVLDGRNLLTENRPLNYEGLCW